MGAFTTKDFAAFLDEALAQVETAEHPAMPRARIPLDVLDGAGARGSEIPDADAAAEYLFAMAGVPPIAPELLPELPSIDPEAIARELGLGRRHKPAELDRMRREFAFSNHPDRVAPELRERAIARMQIANRMIDDAKRRHSRA